MKTIQERNNEAMERMSKRNEELLDRKVEMSVRDLVEFTDAVVEFSKYAQCHIESELTRFLLADVDFSDIGEPQLVVPRHKTFEIGGLGIAIRDWDNRYEMGK